MKSPSRTQPSNQTASALLLTMIMTGAALAVLGSAMAWSASNTRLTHRSIQYNRSVAAAEAATEKVLTQITRDYLSGGEVTVNNNLASYRLIYPQTADSAFWNQWEFNDGAGQTARTYVQIANATTYVVLNSTFSGLRGFVRTCTVASHARDTAALQNAVGGVLQEIQLARIPIFQFAMYSSSDMEISCGQPFTINGKVHSNSKLYVEPGSVLTFQSDVTAVSDILFQRHPLDTRAAPTGSAIYEIPKLTPVSAMTLPIGITNTPEAIREIIQPAPTGENPNSPLGRLRYHNMADMVVVVSNASISASSGRFNNFATTIPASEVAAMFTTTNSFVDAREEKTVRPLDINIAALKAWSQTNATLRVALGARDVSSLYVLDLRTLAGTDLAAVRVRNGTNLPSLGLTVATARPLYVLGNYNQTNASNLGTSNTVNTAPASLVADAITILSTAWTDGNSGSLVALRNAAATTVNAALLTGVVETTLNQYSGGMENFPRFLETWGLANALRYNGSMVKMFPSLYATNVWGKANVYSPPKRDWAYDVNFNDAAKLPPLTPSLLKVVRGKWVTVAAGSNVAPPSP